MKFFEKVRPEIFIHTAKFKRDKKTGKRVWQFMLIVTMGTEELAKSCDVSIVKAWQYVTTREAAAVDVLIATEIERCGIQFFAAIDDADAALELESVDLAGLRMTREGNVVEFWFGGQHENFDELHAFMKKYAYTRLWAQFAQQQPGLPLKPGKKGQ